MADDREVEITGAKVGSGDYEGWSYATICLRLEADEIPAAEEALRRFVGEVNELAEKHPGVRVLGGMRETIDCMSQNLELARRTLRQETRDQANRN